MNVGEVITYDLICIFAFGLFLLFVAGIQHYFGKVYTRGRANIKWHDKMFVSKEEAPYVYWIIIGLQFLIGVIFILASVIELYNRIS